MQRLKHILIQTVKHGFVERSNDATKAHFPQFCFSVNGNPMLEMIKEVQLSSICK